MDLDDLRDLPTPSWTLNRVSPKTRVDNLLAKVEHKFHPAEVDAMKYAHRQGTLYRFRIAHGPWYFATSPEQAIQQALHRDMRFLPSREVTHV